MAQERGQAEGHGQAHGVGIERISAKRARREVAAGRALLVCAYDDEAKCQRLRLERAITLHDVLRRLEGVPKSQQLIFYWA